MFWRIFTVVFACFVTWPVTVSATDFAALTSVIPDYLSSRPKTESDPTFRVGAYFGALSEQPLWPVTSCESTLLCPWKLKFVSSYLIDMPGVYTLYRFSALPFELELEGGFAQRFGRSNQSEVRTYGLAHGTGPRRIPPRSGTIRAHGNDAG